MMGMRIHPNRVERRTEENIVSEEKQDLFLYCKQCVGVQQMEGGEKSTMRIQQDRTLDDLELVLQQKILL